MIPTRGNLLVVEDDREINALIGAYAEMCGFQYRPALDGTAAIAEAERQTPSAIVLDLMLPDVDGLEVCRTLRGLPALNAIPIIILTALSAEADKQRGMESGADVYLTKPFDPDLLMKTLCECTKKAPGN